MKDGPCNNVVGVGVNVPNFLGVGVVLAVRTLFFTSTSVVEETPYLFSIHGIQKMKMKKLSSFQNETLFQALAW